MTYYQVYDMIPRVFRNAFDGWVENYNNSEKSKWFRTRWMTTHLLNIHLGRSNKISPQKLLKFDWEEQNENLQNYEDSFEQVKKIRKFKNAK